MNVTEQGMAKLAVNKSLLKEYASNYSGRTVYMNNGDEFQIQLYNPTDEEIAAGIWIDNEKLSNLLILRPGERVWLERYLDKPKKFKFVTYEVEDNVETEKAISHNGDIKVEFYKKIIKLTYVTDTWPKLTMVNDDCFGICDTVYNSTTVGDVANYCSSNTLDVCTNSLTASSKCVSKGIATPCACDNTIETGRVQEGSYSSQKFNQCDDEFNSWPFKTETLKILPESRKPYTSNDLEKIYCSECGRKLKTKYKFCPYCGTKIDY